MNGKILFTALLSMATISKAMAQDTKTVTLRIIETSDVHGCFFPYDFVERKALRGSLARVSSYVNKLREEYHQNVILLDNGEAAGVICDTKVTLVPFDEVSGEHAFREGEGDRSLAYWQKVHREAFAPDYEAAGKPFDEHGLCVLEEFVLRYPAIAK